MPLEVIELGQNKYWIDFDKDGKVQDSETITINDTNREIVSEKLVEFASTGFSKDCLGKFNLYSKVTFYPNREVYLNTAYERKYANVAQIRANAINFYEQAIPKLDRVISQFNLKDDHPYVKLKKDLEAQIQVLREIRIRVFDFSKLDPNNPAAKNAYAAYKPEENTLDINTRMIQHLGFRTIIHELDHAITFGASKKWQMPTRVLIGDKLNCEIPLPPGQKKIKPTKKNATIEFELDFPTQSSKSKLTYNSLLHYHDKMPTRATDDLKFEPICKPDEVHQNMLAFETKGFQTMIRWQLFEDGISPQVFIDLKSKDKSTRGKAVSYLIKKFPLEGTPQDRNFRRNNFTNLMKLHYFGLGIQQDNQLHDLYEFLAWPGGPYAKLPDAPGCKSNKLPKLE